MHKPTVRTLLALLALSGCRLIDQRTFERAPETPSAAALARPLLPAAPVVRLQPAAGGDWRAALDAAVKQALAGKPDAAFDVMTPVPIMAKRADQDRFVRDGIADAKAVAAALQQDGVPEGRVTIGFQGDFGQAVREVRLYVH